MTVVELLPVHQFDPQEGNYWGYMTLNFFAPHQGYAVRDAVAEFREMVRAFHAAGIEVWLDVVYNHTCEGDRDRPDVFVPRHRQQQLLLARAGRAIPQRQRLRQHAAVRTRVPRAAGICAACGIGRNMRVDGFRFDLASVFARDAARPSANRGCPRMISEITALATSLDLRARGRGVGHRRVSAGSELSRADVAAVERPIPRRCARVRQRRCRQGRRVDAAVVRQRRFVSRRPRRRVPAVPERQLHHRARWLLSVRSGRLQPQAQRGQRPQQYATARTTT